VAAPRAVRESQASQFDRIFVMTTLAPANTAAGGGTTLPRPTGGPQSFRAMPEQMQNRRGMGGMGGPPDAGDPNDDRADDADEPRANRPPLGMRPGEPMAPPADSGTASASPMVRPGVMATPGATTPTTAAKPGQTVPTPQKPPGDLR